MCVNEHVRLATFFCHRLPICACLFLLQILAILFPGVYILRHVYILHTKCMHIIFGKEYASSAWPAYNFFSMYTSMCISGCVTSDKVCVGTVICSENRKHLVLWKSHTYLQLWFSDLLVINCHKNRNKDRIIISDPIK